MDWFCRKLYSPMLLREKRRTIQLKTLETVFARSCTMIQSSTSMDDDAQQMKVFIKNMFQTTTTTTPQILGIVTQQNKLYLNLNSDNSTTCVPLNNFCELLSVEFEQQLTSITLCFISDASSGLGTTVLGQITTTCDAGMVSLDSFGLILLLLFLKHSCVF